MVRTVIPFSRNLYFSFDNILPASHLFWLAGFLFLQSTLLNFDYWCGRAAPLLRKVHSGKHPVTQAKIRRGALFLGDWLRSFSCRQNRGRRWFVCPKNDTSLVFCFRWRGVHLFSSLQPCSFSKSSQEQTAPSTSMIKASAQAILSLRLVTRLKRLISTNF